jgi:hypothetical protein
MNLLHVTRGVKHRHGNMAARLKEKEGKMEQLPQWLTAAIDAAGMTAFAEGLEPKTIKHTPKSRLALDDELPILPLH